MRILLVEPNYRKSIPAAKRNKALSDDILWYPPLGLLKLARYHRDLGDEVKFVSGCDQSVLPKKEFFNSKALWDRVYITTLFTFDFKRVIETIEFYMEAVGGTKSRIFIGGIMASIAPEAILEATSIYPHCGVLNSPRDIKLEGELDIDVLAPDYSILDASKYAINDTFYGYTTRGCINRCSWCGVPKIEPKFIPYIDIKPMIVSMREQFGDKPVLKLMDNNVLASKKLKTIIKDLIELGYGRNQYTKAKKQRLVDFNQGLDATFINEETIKEISKINIRPFRVAFDRIEEKATYINALRLAHSVGVPEISNYILYNYNDSPKDLYDRLLINIELNEEWLSDDISSRIFSYPMRYAPINDAHGSLKIREVENQNNIRNIDWKNHPKWTKRFARNVEIMKGVAHGAISSTPALARRTIGETFQEFICNLYMPEELIRYRNEHEKKIYANDKLRKPGSGKIEKFRDIFQNY
jgi:hypothetical protein